MRADPYPPKIQYVTHEDAPGWRVRIHAFFEWKGKPGMIYVTLQRQAHYGRSGWTHDGREGYGTWLDQYSGLQKFTHDELFDAVCYAHDLIRKCIGQPATIKDPLT